MHVEKASEQYWQLESSCRNNSLLRFAKQIVTGDQVDQKTCEQESTHLRQFWLHRKKHHYTDDTCCEIALRMKASLAILDHPCHRHLNLQSTELYTILGKLARQLGKFWHIQWNSERSLLFKHHLLIVKSWDLWRSFEVEFERQACLHPMSTLMRKR